MIRKQFYLPVKQAKKLTDIAKDKGISVAELVRRILDDYFERAQERNRDKQNEYYG